MPNKTVQTPQPKEGINPVGILAALTVFVLVSLALIWATGRVGANNEHPLKAAASSPKTAPAGLVGETKPQPSETAKQPETEKSGILPELEGPAATEQKPEPETENNQVIADIPKPAAFPDATRETKPAAAKKDKKTSSKPAGPSTTVDVRRTGGPSEPLKPIVDTDLPGEEAKSSERVEKVDAKTIGGKTVLWYSVRAGYTDSKVRADILRDVLKDQGYATAETVSTGQNTYFVTLGDYQYRYQAEEVADGVKQKTGLIPRIYEKTVAK